MPLTPKQQDYVAARIAGSAPSEAYRIAYDASKMSVASVAKEANTLDNHPVIAPMLERAQTKVAEKAVVTAQMILERAWTIANSDAKDRAQHLAIAARAFPEFKDGITVDNSQHVHLPEGLTVEELRTLASGH